MQLFNYTGREIYIEDEIKGRNRVIDVDKLVLEEKTIEEVGEIDGIKILETHYEWYKNAGLPDYVEGVFYIVESDIAEIAKKIGRRTDDLFIPAGKVHEDWDGAIVCQGLARV